MSSRSIRIDPFNPILKLMRSATELVSGKLHLTKESDQTYINFLNQTTIGSMWDCIKPIQMHAIDSEANVMDTLLFLQSHKISSVPLMTTQNELVGVIDIVNKLKLFFFFKCFLFFIVLLLLFFKFLFSLI